MQFFVKKILYIYKGYKGIFNYKIREDIKMGISIGRIGAVNSSTPAVKGIEEKEEPQKGKMAYASSLISVFQGQNSGTQEASGFLG